MRAGGWCDWCGNSDRGSVKAGVGAVALLDRSEEEPQELGMAGGWDVGVGWDSGVGDGVVQVGAVVGALLDRSEEEPQELGMAPGWDVGVGAI